MAEETEKNIKKRGFKMLDMSPESEQRVHKHARVRSPLPIADLPEATPRWTTVMYNALNDRMTSIETGIHEAIDFTADTVTDAIAASGVNIKSILKLEDRSDQLEIEILKEKKENNELRERVLAQEGYSRRDNLLFHEFP